MSDTDPDLKPTEQNRPIAIDVVDGKLVLKRHDGREETFGLGLQLIREDWLEFYIDETDVPIGNDTYHSLGPATGTALYDKTYSNVGADVIITDIPVDGHGLEVGDNFVLANKEVYFRKPGVYKATVETSTPGFIGGDWLYRMHTTLGGGDYSVVSALISPEATGDTSQELMFVVHPETVLHNAAEEVWTPGDLISSSSQGFSVDGWQNVADPGEILLDIYISRILG